MRRSLLLISLIVQLFCFSQSDSSYYYFDRVTPKSTVIEKINSVKETELKAYYNLVYHSKVRDVDSIFYYLKILGSGSKLPDNLKPRYIYFKAYYFRIKQNDSLSYKFHNEALKKATLINDTLTILASLSGLSQSYSYDDDMPYRWDYLEKLASQSDKFNNQNYNIIASYLKGNFHLIRDNGIEALEFYKQTFNNDFNHRDSSILVKTLSNIGVLYNEVLNKPDSALVYYKQKMKIIDENKMFQTTDNYFTTYLNLASIYQSKEDYNTALLYLAKADSIDLKENILNSKRILKESLSKVHYELGNYKKAFSYYEDYFEFTDSINRRALAKGIAKYENQELRIQNLESEAKRKQNQNIALGLGGSLALGSIIALLIFKNTKRKQKLAEKEKALETQKLATVLKEQELTTIDAMIEGQEKERRRIANDLHDDLGGLMATVKLHFNALKDKRSPELYNKTNNLIEEAYQKVRSVAHAKNSGVIAKQGLLKAVQNMADKVSGSNKLQIDVLDHGLDDRLENSLELTLFRVIQELITNIIKHAGATEANIHITNHEDSINIMVEDNGKGFNPAQITKTNKGMGISSIDKRVAHLDGNMTIESERNKGTTVIIDIPL